MSGHREALDNALAARGEDVTLRRVAAKGINIDVQCRAVVTAVSEKQVEAGVDQTSLNVILSPTQILDAQWPGGQTVPNQNYPNLPWLMIPNDKIQRVATGRWHNILAPIKPFIVDGEVVRIELIVMG